MHELDEFFVFVIGEDDLDLKGTINVMEGETTITKAYLFYQSSNDFIQRKDIIGFHAKHVPCSILKGRLVDDVVEQLFATFKEM